MKRVAVRERSYEGNGQGERDRGGREEDGWDSGGRVDGHV